MDALLTKQNISVKSEHDRVILSIGRTDFTLPYAVSFKIAQGLKVAGKHSLRMSGGNIKDWRQYATLDEYPLIKPVSTEKRKTLTGRFTWSVRVDRERVFLDIGNNELQVNFQTALKISELIRSCGKAAKRWAGDTGRMLHGAGWLSDANKNERNHF